MHGSQGVPEAPAYPRGNQYKFGSATILPRQKGSLKGRTGGLPEKFAKK
jgi:hypothetical protein